MIKSRIDLNYYSTFFPQQARVALTSNFKIPKTRKIWVKQENTKVNYEKNNSQIVQPTCDNILSH